MKYKIFSVSRFFILSLVGLISLISVGYAQEPNAQAIDAQAVFGTAFTYQGVLKDGGVPANDSYEFRFKLYDASGNPVGTTIVQTVGVSGGQFSTELDFGVDAFTGGARYLELGVRPAGSSDTYTTLSPRQELTPTPYALHSRSAFWLNAADGDPTRAVYVDNIGWVGIGTQTPGQKLHLTDGHFLLEGGGETAIILKRDITYTGGPSGISQNPIFHIGRIIQAGDGDPEIRFLYEDENTTEISVFEFDRKGIVASVKQDRGSHFEGFISGTDPEPVFRLNSWPKMRLEMGPGGSTPVDTAIQREAANTLTFITGATERLRIDSAGNIGIGTTAPTDRLHVAGGNIRVEGGSFIDDGTTLNVPDYVFEEDYPLMPLDELQRYIDQEKHLPNVPGAAEIEENGLNISEFQMSLLEKIEELTLHTLAQQESIEALQQQVLLLQQENTALKEQLSALK